MTRLEFRGKVSCGDGCRVSYDEVSGAVHIKGIDVVDAIAEESWTKNVRVILDGNEVANGHLVAEVGWGYSDWTPMDSDEVLVGECNLVDQLQVLEGQSVHLIVEDVE